MLEAPLFAFLGAFVLNLIVTPYVIRQLRRSAILDVPNERSSHETPIPRGGGLVIVFTWVLGMVATWAIRFPFPALGILAPDGFVVSATIGMVVLAAVGFADDRMDLNPILKLLVQIVVGVQAISLSGLQVTDLGLPLAEAYGLGAWGWAVGVLWLVGFTNIFNFMDGINGLAFTQLIIGGSAFSLLGVWTGDYELAVSGALAAGSAMGILKYNFPKALVFMGDVGSLPSGFLLAMLGLRTAFGVHAEPEQGLNFLVPVLILWPFLYDGSYTLLNRLVHGRNPIKAHRSHLYQRLIVRGFSHKRITTGYAVWMVVCAVAGYMLPTFSPAWVQRVLIFTALVSLCYTVTTVIKVRASMT